MVNTPACHAGTAGSTPVVSAIAERASRYPEVATQTRTPRSPLAEGISLPSPGGTQPGIPHGGVV